MDKRLVILIMLAILVWAVNLFFHPDYASSSDTYLYAGITRNIISGHGILEPGTIPLYFSYSLPTSSFGWPLFHSPLFPLSAVIFFLVFGQNLFSLILTNGFFYLLTLPIIYFLAKKIYNSKVAFLASVWYIFLPSVMIYSTSGMSESLFTFLISAFFLAVISKKFFLAGLIVGLAYLARFQAILILPPLLFYLYQKRAGFSSAAFFIGGLFIIFAFKKVFIPPLSQDFGSLENHTLWGAIASNAFITNSEFERGLNIITSQEVMNNINFVLFKIVSNFYYFFQKIPTLTLPAISVLYALSFFRKESRDEGGLKFLSLSFFAVFLIFHMITLFDFRYLHPLLPVMLIFATNTFLSFTKQNLKMAAIFTLFLIIIPSFAEPGWGTSIQRTLQTPRKPTINEILGQIAKEKIPPNAIVASQDFPALTWYGGQRGLALPLYFEDLDKIEAEFFPIDAIFLSSWEFKSPLDPIWKDLLENPHDFGHFKFAESFEVKPEENHYRLPAKIVLYLKSP